MRVISGKAKGRKLEMVPGGGTRPISDRAKKALFDIVGADIEGAHLLDLFAGTGSVGIEALSRGAARVVFVDSSARAVRTVRDNLERVALQDGAELVTTDAFAYLVRPVQAPFDYVYVAPPQHQGLWSRALYAIDARPEWLNPDAWVVAQIHPVEYQALALAHLSEFDQRRYGTTLLCFYEFSAD